MKPELSPAETRTLAKGSVRTRLSLLKVGPLSGSWPWAWTVLGITRHPLTMICDYVVRPSLTSNHQAWEAIHQPGSFHLEAEHISELGAQLVSCPTGPHHHVARGNYAIMSLDLVLSPARLPLDQLFLVAGLTGRSTHMVIVGFKQLVGPRVVTPEVGEAVEPRQVRRKDASPSEALRLHLGQRAQEDRRRRTEEARSRKAVGRALPKVVLYHTSTPRRRLAHDYVAEANVRYDPGDASSNTDHEAEANRGKLGLHPGGDRGGRIRAHGASRQARNHDIVLADAAQRVEAIVVVIQSKVAVLFVEQLPRSSKLNGEGRDPSHSVGIATKASPGVLSAGSFVSMIQLEQQIRFLSLELSLPRVSVFGLAKNWIDPRSAFLLGVGVQADECGEHGPTRRELDVDALGAQMAALPQPVLDTHPQRVHKRAVQDAEHEPREDDDGVPVAQGAGSHAQHPLAGDEEPQQQPEGEAARRPGVDTAERPIQQSVEQLALAVKGAPGSPVQAVGRNDHARVVESPARSIPVREADGGARQRHQGQVCGSYIQPGVEGGDAGTSPTEPSEDRHPKVGTGDGKPWLGPVKVLHQYNHLELLSASAGRLLVQPRIGDDRGRPLRLSTHERRGGGAGRVQVAITAVNAVQGLGLSHRVQVAGVGVVVGKQRSRHGRRHGPVPQRHRGRELERMQLFRGINQLNQACERQNAR
ncbi:hypothetical protein MKX08_009081 [Trichoderma sp. CBMAI-0020]|nr:hypothetical protein MKX08_009081 [Trichoderma sp. CBMAI-0020]